MNIIIIAFYLNYRKKIEKPKQDNKKKRKYVCSTCKKDFVDERALLWHERLHKNERPYVCDVSFL